MYTNYNGFIQVCPHKKNLRHISLVTNLIVMIVIKTDDYFNT